jgi:hypothetical protein
MPQYTAPESVYIVIRASADLGGPEVDVFATLSAAEDHAARLGADRDGNPIVREEIVNAASWLDA